MTIHGEDEWHIASIRLLAGINREALAQRRLQDPWTHKIMCMASAWRMRTKQLLQARPRKAKESKRVSGWRVRVTRMASIINKEARRAKERNTWTYWAQKRCSNLRRIVR